MMEDDNHIVTEQPHEPVIDESHVPQEETQGNEESSKSSYTEDSEDAPQSSIENIIPLNKLKRGWFAVSGIFSEAAQKVQESAIEAYNSESVQQIKRRTSEAITPAWEKTVEVAAPVWEQTKVTAHAALEKTKEGMTIAAEKVKPTLDTVCFFCV
jgi:hypothetical protein